MHHASPVRWCVALRIRYMTGSRRLMLPEVMSILARRVLAPSSNSPRRMRSRRSRLSDLMRGLADPVHDGIAQVDVAGGHVDLGAQGLGAVLELAPAHALEEIQALRSDAWPCGSGT